jgi:hypothetical protein
LTLFNHSFKKKTKKTNGENRQINSCIDDLTRGRVSAIIALEATGATAATTTTVYKTQ